VVRGRGFSLLLEKQRFGKELTHKEKDGFRMGGASCRESKLPINEPKPLRREIGISLGVCARHCQKKTAFKGGGRSELHKNVR